MTASVAAPARRSGLLGVALVAACAGATFHRAFTTGDLALPVLAAASVPVALVAVQHLRPSWRLPVAGSLLASAAGWVLVALAVLFPHGSAVHASPPAALADGLVNGWARLLDVTLPAGSSPDLLTLPFTLTWIAAAVGAELVTRTRATVLPALPATAAFAVGVAFTVSGPGSNVWVSGAFVLCAGGLTLARTAGPRLDDRGRTLPRRIPRGVPAGAALAGMAALIGPFTPMVHGRTPFDLRAERTVELHPQTGVSPLDEISAWLTQPAVPLFRVTYPAGTPTGTVPDLRLAVLDRFDGQSWTSSARFVPAGTRVPAAQVSSPGETRLEQRIDVLSGLTGTLLPAVDRPDGLRGTGIAADPVSGALVSTTPVRAGFRYTVTSTLRPLPPKDQLAALSVATGAPATADEQLPPDPNDVVGNLIACARGRSRLSALQTAYRLQSCLHDSGDFRFAADATPGHTYGHIAAFLSGPRSTGTFEKFAVTYAVAARRLGLPTRIVVGFSHAQTGSTDVITTRDIVAWPEVDFAGYGWLAFDPTPAPTGAGDAAVAATTTQAARTREIAAAATAPVSGPAITAAPVAATTRHHSVVPPLVEAAAGVAGAAALSYALLAASGPARRRGRRQREGTPRARIIGAWHDALDTMDGAGLRVPRAATPTEVVRHGELAGSGVGTSLRPLAQLATAALFDAMEPAAGTDDAAWRHEARLRGQIRRAVPLSRRVRHGVAFSRVSGGRSGG